MAILDFNTEPFSVCGSYLAINKVEKNKWPKGYCGIDRDGIYLRNVGCGNRGAIGRIVFLEDGREVSADYEMRPGLLTFTSGAGNVQIAFEDVNTLRFRGDGLTMKILFTIVASENAQPYPGGHWYVNSFCQRAQLMLSDIKSSVNFEIKWAEYGCSAVSMETSGEEWEFSAEIFEGAWQPKSISNTLPFDKCAEKYGAVFGDFYGKFTGISERYRSADFRAAYVDWTSTVGARGNFKRDAMLMSKNWMIAVWSWDHCFNAMALAGAHPDLAWDQFCIPFDNQHKSGLLPDTCMHDDIAFGFTKPPIHGWTLDFMMRRMKFTGEQLAWIYPRLSSWTDYWHTYADWDKDGVCQYSHGNDCGWDNCSGYLVGAPVEGPDLSAYLGIQMHTLASLAFRLGKPGEAESWERKAGNQLDNLVSHSWTGERFKIPQSSTHKEQPDCDSLYAFLPLILGSRLPADIFRKLADGLKQNGRFLTANGLATESVSSAKYIPDGYWLGPIWAPPMFMIIMGLADGGETAFAVELAKRFCDMMSKEGFAENFDAVSGKSLRDPAYTWTSSVFMLLVRMLEDGSFV